MKIFANAPMFTKMVETSIATEPQIKNIVERHKPDVYVINHNVGSPTLIYSSKPWVFIVCTNPLYWHFDERTPPAGSGFPSNGDKNSEEWKQFRELNDNMFADSNQVYNKWLNENGFPTIEKRLIPNSPYLNIYGYPEELDYTDIRAVPENWCQVDTFARKEEPQEFILADNLKNRDEDKQKLIYLSLGSMGSVDIELMKRLVNILAKSPHKTIVSKGLLGDKYDLPDNMWGQNSVPQINVLPLVDLAITHGGNNTISETLSFGKPMIVMPLFTDQFDNAQRVHEKGFGIRMDPYNCTEQELLAAIEKLLSDQDLKNRLKIASERMANSQSLVQAAQRIERLVF